MHKNRKASGVHESSLSPRKVCDENETKKKKGCACKNVIHGEKPFVMPIQKTGENNLHKLGETIVDTMKVLFI